MAFTGNYKLLCGSQPARLIAEAELQGGLGGSTGSPFGEPELPEHLQDEEAKETSYVEQLGIKVEEIKGDIENPNVSAASIANELVEMIRENTNWGNKAQAKKGKIALSQILGNMGLKHMAPSPDMQIPEQEDWEGYDQWNLKIKRGLHYFAYNQYLVAKNLGTVKLQHPSQHTTPHYDDVNRNNVALTESFDAVENFLKKAMKLYFLPITFPIELIVKAVRGEADGKEQAAAINAIDQANSENPELERVDLWKQIEAEVEAPEGDQGDQDEQGEYASPELDRALSSNVYMTPGGEGELIDMEESIPSLAALEVLAKCDTPTFCNILESVGLRVLGTHEFDPLDVRVKEQTVTSLASNMTEAIDDDIDLDPELAAIKNLAESFGYIVEIGKIT